MTTRPRLHLTSPTGWINDPHGITVHDGLYHLFHQYVPGSMTHLPACHWGHAVSEDLLHWEHRPTAISPGDGDDGIWTGSLVSGPDGAVILYTSVQEADYGQGRVRLAYPVDEDWDEWRKGDIVLSTPTDLDLIAFRDPFVVADSGRWRMFIGAANGSGDAMALTYLSDDLRAWRYDGVALRRSTNEREPVWTGALWECPQFVDVDGRWAMVSSVWDDDVLHYTAFSLGVLDQGRFDAQVWGRLSFGQSYYAPSFFRDADGRPCLMFWIRGVRDDEAGWSSALSIPYELSVTGDRLVATPHRNLERRRGPRIGAEELVALDSSVPLDLEWLPADGDTLALRDTVGVAASLRLAAGKLVLERRGEPEWSMPHADGVVRVILDGPVLEVATAGGVLGGPIAEPTAVVSAGGALTAWRLPTRG